MVDPYAIVRRLTGHELISPKDAQLLTEAVDGLIDQIGSKDTRIADLAAENERLKQEIAATQEKLIRANDELIQRNSKALSRPTERAVTEAAFRHIVEAGYHIGFIKAMDGATDEIREVADKAKAALKAAMEAGHHD